MNPKRREGNNHGSSLLKLHQMRRTCAWKIRTYFNTIYLYESASSRKIISRDKGKSSIQINGLPAFLKKKTFQSLKAFSDEYSVEYDKKNRRLKNFKLFIIMDTDDCEESIKQKYISGKLFSGHPLKEYIVPIYNIEIWRMSC